MAGDIRFLPRRCARAGAAMLAALIVATPLSAAAATKIEGYRTLRAEKIAPGVVHEVYQRFTPNEAVHVARVGKDAPYILRSVPANRFLHGRNETTSEICKRTKCLVGVNGDFWKGSEGLLGALVHHGELLRSPSAPHYQFVIGPDGKPTAGPIRWHGRFITSDGKSFDLGGVNVPRRGDGLVLYSRAFARSTKTGHGGIELVVSLVDGGLRLGQPTKVQIEKLFVGGNTKINDGRLVLSGTGTGAEILRTLWHRSKNGGIDRTFDIRLRTTPDALESIGGTPVLVRGGKPAYDNASTAFVRAQHPRTIVGWTKTGETLLVTVDGRQAGHSAGMTIPEAARMMIKLGAVDAINLDGGGSTTFVVRGKVLNKPSDRVVSVAGAKRVVKVAANGARTLAPNVERPVASALVVVKRPVEKPKVAVTVTPGKDSTTHAAAADLIEDLGVVESAAAPRPDQDRSTRAPLFALLALLAVAGAGARRFHRRRVCRNDG